MQNTKVRRPKISRIAKISKRAPTSMSGSVYSVATWGHQMNTLFHYELDLIEKEAVRAAGLDKKGGCRFFLQYVVRTEIADT